MRLIPWQNLEYPLIRTPNSTDFAPRVARELLGGFPRSRSGLSDHLRLELAEARKNERRAAIAILAPGGQHYSRVHKVGDSLAGGEDDVGLRRSNDDRLVDDVPRGNRLTASVLVRTATRTTLASRFIWEPL